MTQASVSEFNECVLHDRHVNTFIRSESSACRLSSANIWLIQAKSTFYFVVCPSVCEQLTVRQLENLFQFNKSILSILLVNNEGEEGKEGGGIRRGG